MTEMAEPRLIKGALAVDDRGKVGFVNEFDFTGVKRFYVLRNHRQGFVRAWHAHRREGKYFMAVRGSALVCGVEIDDWDHPSASLPVHRFVLAEHTPAVLYLPPGFANGFCSLTQDATLMVYSTATLQESLADDVRYNARYWDPWNVEER